MMKYDQSSHKCLSTRYIQSIRMMRRGVFAFLDCFQCKPNLLRRPHPRFEGRKHDLLDHPQDCDDKLPRLRDFCGRWPSVDVGLRENDCREKLLVVLGQVTMPIEPLDRTILHAVGAPPRGWHRSHQIWFFLGGQCSDSTSASTAGAYHHLSRRRRCTTAAFLCYLQLL